MKRASFIGYVSLAIWISCVCFSNNASAQESQGEMIKRVENGLTAGTRIKGAKGWSIQERMEHHGVPGMSLAVIKDYQVVWARAYGVKDRETNEPVTTSTLFQCASISKPLSSAAALAMVENGAFVLDENVNEYLKSWKLPENEFTEAEKVTLERLVSHQAGLTVHGFLGYTVEQEMPTLIQLLDGETPANSSPIRVDTVPGSNRRYSGGGYCVMQQMIIDNAGKPFPETMDSLVLKPLGMQQSTYRQPLPNDRLSEAATGYLPDGAMVSGKRHTYPEMAAAGLWSNAKELAKFWIELQLAYNGKGDNKVLSSEMAKRMLDDQLGVFKKERGSGVYFGHGGWNEGFSSDCMFHIKDGFGVVVLTNGNQPPFIDEVINSVAHAYEWPGEPKAIEVQDSTASQRQNLVGRYNKSGEIVRIVEREQKLFFDEPGRTPSELLLVKGNRFVRLDHNRGVAFSQDESSKAWQFSFTKFGESDVPSEIVATRLADSDILPIEWLESDSDGDFEKAKAAYLAFQTEDPSHMVVSEDYLNSFGYNLLGRKEFRFAIQVFQMNTILHPEAFNTWDSLAEAYLITGDTEKAILNYQKSLKLNPENRGAEEALRKLGE